MEQILKKIENMEKSQKVQHAELKKSLEDRETNAKTNLDTQSKLLFQKIEDLSVKVDPVVAIYTDLSGTGRILKWCFIVLTAIGGAIITIKAIFTGFVGHKIL